MKERPMLFSAPMVRAILAGTKTQTRRVAKGLALQWLEEFSPEFVALPENGLCPYGQPGDRLWVRETWLRHSTNKPNDFLYRADHPDDEIIGPAHGGWKPSIHMPRWASRIPLEITSVRVERLQEISEADAKAEGVEWLDHPPACVANEPACGWRGYVNHEPLYRDTARESFMSLWQYINGPGSWDANPWVWVVTFNRVEAA